MKRNKTERFMDCVALKRQAQARIRAETQGMSAAEQIAYYRRRAESSALGAWWKRVSRLSETPMTVHEKPAKYGGG